MVAFMVSRLGVGWLAGREVWVKVGVFGSFWFGGWLLLWSDGWWVGWLLVGRSVVGLWCWLSGCWGSFS